MGLDILPIQVCFSLHQIKLVLSTHVMRNAMLSNVTKRSGLQLKDVLLKHFHKKRYQLPAFYPTHSHCVRSQFRII